MLVSGITTKTFGEFWEDLWVRKKKNTVKELRHLLGNSLQSEFFMMTGPLIKFYTTN